MKSWHEIKLLGGFQNLCWARPTIAFWDWDWIFFTCFSMWLFVLLIYTIYASILEWFLLKKSYRFQYIGCVRNCNVFLYLYLLCSCCCQVCLQPLQMWRTCPRHLSTKMLTFKNIVWTRKGLEYPLQHLHPSCC